LDFCLSRRHLDRLFIEYRILTKIIEGLMPVSMQ